MNQFSLLIILCLSAVHALPNRFPTVDTETYSMMLFKRDGNLVSVADFDAAFIKEAQALVKPSTGSTTTKTPATTTPAKIPATSATTPTAKTATTNTANSAKTIQAASATVPVTNKNSVTNTSKTN